jgi:hypothetical protein
MAIRARFIVVNKEVRDGVVDIQLRATKQTDVANTENPILWTENESSQNQIRLRIKNSQERGVFFKGKEVYVDFSGPV